MNITVDATGINELSPSGMSNYAVQLLRHLSHQNDINKYTVYSLRFNLKDSISQTHNIEYKRIPDIFSFWKFWFSWLSWYYTAFPFQLSRDKPDVYLGMYPSLPLFCPCPKIIVVYDLSPLTFSQFFPAGFGLLFKLQIVNAIKRADRIIAISKSTKDDLVKLLKADPVKITVVYPGYDTSIFKPVLDTYQIKIVKQRYGIDSDYIIYVGTLEPRKNIKRLIEGFAELVKKGDVNHKLVIAGKKGWLYDEIFETLSILGLNSEIIFTDYAPLEDLPPLLSGADAFIYPSLYEGFGLPVLEAMACGTPVITSRVSSLPEVIGDAGILIDPYNVKDIALAMQNVVSDKELRKRMRQKGLERANLFSWETAAESVINLFKDVYSLRKVDK